ncbi:unnamed protein product [Amoebophrya sp. A120]|nr:unnamed protein product [Amoebophrya sp. A120]|eukprot:GSA120T00009490001.1
MDFLTRSLSTATSFLPRRSRSGPAQTGAAVHPVPFSEDQSDSSIPLHPRQRSVPIPEEPAGLHDEDSENEQELETEQSMIGSEDNSQQTTADTVNANNEEQNEDRNEFSFKRRASKKTADGSSSRSKGGIAQDIKSKQSKSKGKNSRQSALLKEQNRIAKIQQCLYDKKQDEDPIFALLVSDEMLLKHGEILGGCQDNCLDGKAMIMEWINKHRRCELEHWHPFDLEVEMVDLRRMARMFSYEKLMQAYFPSNEENAIGLDGQPLTAAEKLRMTREKQTIVRRLLSKNASEFAVATNFFRNESSTAEKKNSEVDKKEENQLMKQEQHKKLGDLVLQGSWQASDEDGVAFLFTLNLTVLQVGIQNPKTSIVEEIDLTREELDDRVQQKLAEMHTKYTKLRQQKELEEAETEAERASRKERGQKETTTEGGDSRNNSKDSATNIAYLNQKEKEKGNKTGGKTSTTTNTKPLYPSQTSNLIDGTIEWHLVYTKNPKDPTYGKRLHRTYRKYLDQHVGCTAVERVRGMQQGGCFYLSGYRVVDPFVKQVPHGGGQNMDQDALSLVQVDQYVIKWDPDAKKFRGVSRNMHGCPDVRHWAAHMIFNPDIAYVSPRFHPFFPNMEFPAVAKQTGLFGINTNGASGCSADQQGRHHLPSSLCTQRTSSNESLFEHSYEYNSTAFSPLLRKHNDSGYLKARKIHKFVSGIHSAPGIAGRKDSVGKGDSNYNSVDVVKKAATGIGVSSTEEGELSSSRSSDEEQAYDSETEPDNFNNGQPIDAADDSAGLTCGRVIANDAIAADQNGISTLPTRGINITNSNGTLHARSQTHEGTITRIRAAGSSSVNDPPPTTLLEFLEGADDKYDQPANIKPEGAEQGNSLAPVVEVSCCSICLEPFQDRVTCPCGHQYCAECLTETMRTQPPRDSGACPLCRQVVTMVSLMRDDGQPFCGGGHFR